MSGKTKIKKAKISPIAALVHPLSLLRWLSMSLALQTKEAK